MITETTFDEVAAIVEAQQGDRAAFGALVRTYQKRAYAVAYSFVGNREDALELAQDSFVKAFKAISRFDTSMPFYPWLYRIVKNTCLNHLKKRKRRGETSLDGLMESGFDVSSEKHVPERDAQLGDLREAMVCAMEGLSEDHREIIAMRHVQEMSYAEMAACLDIPQGTVMSRLHAARRSLRMKLGDIVLEPLAGNVGMANSPGSFA